MFCTLICIAEATIYLADRRWAPAGDGPGSPGSVDANAAGKPAPWIDGSNPELSRDPLAQIRKQSKPLRPCLPARPSPPPSRVAPREPSLRV